MWLVTGLAVVAGMLLTAPFAWAWSRRTERRVRELEQRARSAERLAELGSMTGGLAHEIKNPLSTVGLNVQLLREDLGELESTLPPDRFASMDRRFIALGRETQRLREILEDFLRFAGRMELDCQPVGMNQLVDEVADFYEPELAKQGIRLRRQLTASPDQVSADAGLIKQAILNLLINAMQAMQHAREQEQAHGGANELLLQTELQLAQSPPQLLIHITDTGPGIDKSTQERIFQPYFSTKAGGSGLGLPTTRRIIEEHGGQVTVHSEPGQGTSFIFHLPLLHT